MDLGVCAQRLAQKGENCIYQPDPSSTIIRPQEKHRVIELVGNDEPLPYRILAIHCGNRASLSQRRPHLVLCLGLHGVVYSCRKDGSSNQS